MPTVTSPASASSPARPPAPWPACQNLTRSSSAAAVPASSPPWRSGDRAASSSRSRPSNAPGRRTPPWSRPDTRWTARWFRPRGWLRSPATPTAWRAPTRSSCSGRPRRRPPARERPGDRPGRGNHGRAGFRRPARGCLAGPYPPLRRAGQAGAPPGVGRVRRHRLLPGRRRDHPHHRTAAEEQVDRPGGGLRGRVRPPRGGAGRRARRRRQRAGRAGRRRARGGTRGDHGNRRDRPAEGAIAAVSRALLDKKPTVLETDATWPIPALPVTAGGAGGHRIVITDRVVPADERTVVLRPPSLVVGVGASRGVSEEEVLELIAEALFVAGLSAASVTAIATVEAKAAEEGIVAAARRRGWPVITHPADRLASVHVPNPSDAVRAAVSTPSVAEAASLASADELVVAKRKSAMATVAVARLRPRGRLALVGLGPGARDLLTPPAIAELRRSSVVVGLQAYVDQVADLLRPGTRVLASELGQEEARARTAVEQARRGHAVALVGSGDAGVYAMASPALSLAGDDIDVVAVPGITAALASAALVGAPLGHDHAVISLSDLHTPWEVIERRVQAAAAGDFVVVFYNPRSRGRDWQLGAALEILGRHRAGDTPAAVVRDADRAGEHVTLTTLADLDPATVDMRCVVIVGSASTRTVAGRMVTPRGYRWP